MSGVKTMTKKKRKQKKPMKTAEKIALASLVISVIQWLVTLLLNLKK